MRYTVTHRKGFGDSFLCVSMVVVGALFFLQAMLVPEDAVPDKSLSRRWPELPSVTHGAAW